MISWLDRLTDDAIANLFLASAHLIAAGIVMRALNLFI